MPWRKKVSSYPNRCPSPSKTFPVRYHHSVLNSRWWLMVLREFVVPARLRRIPIGGARQGGKRREHPVAAAVRPLDRHRHIPRPIASHRKRLRRMSYWQRRNFRLIATIRRPLTSGGYDPRQDGRGHNSRRRPSRQAAPRKQESVAIVQPKKTRDRAVRTSDKQAHGGGDCCRQKTKHRCFGRRRSRRICPALAHGRRIASFSGRGDQNGKGRRIVVVTATKIDGNSQLGTSVTAKGCRRRYFEDTV